ncbi:TrkA-N [Candidatus Koribacter versatilis Ellin345]|uniref:TrkA-N n=1 Tax=Koribacter versatilis (strain Ellin345) TaxID=204669 RepID=Q1IML1_KORVE|nr:potassium channel protein [Candidatus Koribacter versatilis]ABF41889.1 TrkA-N [Candidatus Koribacter versatilis Ellin345]
MRLSKRLGTPVLLLVAIITASVVGYRLLGGPDVHILDAIYMAIITLAGVGYGEIIDTTHNPALRIFNIGVIMVGVTFTVYVFSAVTAFLVEGQLTDLFRKRKMQKRLSELKNHYIVCGLGDTGRYVVGELQKTGTPFVVIDQNEEHIKNFIEKGGDAYHDMLYVTGDATDELLLDQARLDVAKGLIAAVAADKDNLVITVLARQKSQKVRIVARWTDQRYSDRLLKSGANATVSPNAIGGMRMASEVLRPHVVGFLDMMLREQSKTLRIEEVVIKGHSPWAGKSLESLQLKALYNLLPLAIRSHGDGKTPNFWVNPPDNVLLASDSVVIVMGDVNDIRRARTDSQEDLEPAAAPATV